MVVVVVVVMVQGSHWVPTKKSLGDKFTEQNNDDTRGSTNNSTHGVGYANEPQKEAGMCSVYPYIHAHLRGFDLTTSVG